METAHWSKETNAHGNYYIYGIYLHLYIHILLKMYWGWKGGIIRIIWVLNYSAHIQMFFNLNSSLVYISATGCNEQLVGRFAFVTEYRPSLGNYNFTLHFPLQRHNVEHDVLFFGTSMGNVMSWMTH